MTFLDCDFYSWQKNNNRKQRGRSRCVYWRVHYIDNAGKWQFLLIIFENKINNNNFQFLCSFFVANNNLNLFKQHWEKELQANNK